MIELKFKIVKSCIETFLFKKSPTFVQRTEEKSWKGLFNFQTKLC